METNEVKKEVKEEIKIIEPRKKILIRRARLADMPQLEDLMVSFYEYQRKKGNKTLAKDPNVLRGGIMLELGMMFHNQNCRIMVADRENRIIGFFIAEIVFCRPIEEHHRAVWIRGDNVIPEIDTLIRGKILQLLWKEIYKWAVENCGTDFYFYGDIHQTNQNSIRTAKSVGFKHYMTRFLKLVSKEDIDNGK